MEADARRRAAAKPDTIGPDVEVGRRLAGGGTVPSSFVFKVVPLLRSGSAGMALLFLVIAIIPTVVIFSLLLNK